MLNRYVTVAVSDNPNMLGDAVPMCKFVHEIQQLPLTVRRVRWSQRLSGRIRRGYHEMSIPRLSGRYPWKKIVKIVFDHPDGNVVLLLLARYA